ncbi:hypothetical protein [Legionella sp.]|uniref:hypothetical protein n=1 Tax=Legionella sp. TaxID=459 RepID=UPI003CBE09D4
MLVEQQKLQHFFVKMLYPRAVKSALNNVDTLLFDPQGRVLINVPLTNKDRELFFSATSRTSSLITTVSLDTSLFPELHQIYLHEYDLNEVQFKQLEKFRGSIIPLQQEFHFHLALVARTYTKMNAKKFPEAQMSLAHAAAMKRVNELVIVAFKDSFAKAKKKSHPLDDIKLVKLLDSARKRIAREAHPIFLEEMIAATGEHLTKNEMKAMHIKDIAEVTTATSNDLLHVDQSLGQFTWIAGSEVTAHDRGLGIQHLADRQIISFRLNETDIDETRVQIRVPSLDVKEGIISIKDKEAGKSGITQSEASEDVAEKLAHLQSNYKMADALSKNPVNNKAFTYNLLTALNDRFEGGKNKQSQGAGFILVGAHLYNARQLKEESPVFCFVQNISVNGFGDVLGYDGNNLKTEATLMAEMAMLHNLVNENDDEDQKEKIYSVFEHYKTYLASENRESFFSQSATGKQVIAQIQNIKENWKHPNSREDISTLDRVNQAKDALKIMMANNLHYQHRYAKIFQSLSVFVEQASIGGCKSGNERAQSIAGRVSILDSVVHNPNDPIVRALLALANASPQKVTEKATALKQHIDKKYDHNLQSAVSLISVVDQGAAAKVNAKRGLIGLLNRNCAEEKNLNHLHQKNAGYMQAHIGLTKLMMRALDGPEHMGFFAYMKAKMGIMGVLAGIIGFPIAGYFHNRYKKEERVKFEQKLDAAKNRYLQNHEKEDNVSKALRRLIQESPEPPVLDFSSVLKKEAKQSPAQEDEEEVEEKQRDNSNAPH